MAARSKTHEITIADDRGTFTTFFRRFTRDSNAYDFEGISAVRKLLSNEKAKILHAIKVDHPKSLYHLAKLVQRDFKSVVDDVKLLEKFGFIDMIAEKTGKRHRLKPVIIVDSVNIHITF
ncbi:hypothetical protein KW805_04595 [Candidatus Pacearchaeota archaeon]|nr:hypothetical protein [Candidatus Pacearchaeota archaeon]